MTITLLFLAGIMGVVVWWLVKQTINTKPWVADMTYTDVRGEALGLPSEKIALWVFLAVVVSLFSLFISAYAMRMELGDWRPLPEPGLLWANTVLLFLGSVFIQRARGAAGRDDLAGVKHGLNAAGAFTIAFMAGQLIAWQQLMASGYLVTSNPANAFFYLLTALHVLHLLGGLVAWGKTTVKVYRGIEVSKVRLSVELCAVYWHFMLVVWLVLFGLMLST